MKPIVNRRYDIEGNELTRLGKFSLFAKVIPVGNLHGGPGARCFVVLSVLHFLGGPLYWLLAKYGQRLQPVKRIVNRFRHNKSLS